MTDPKEVARVRLTKTAVKEPHGLGRSVATYAALEALTAAETELAEARVTIEALAAEGTALMAIIERQHRLMVLLKREWNHATAKLARAVEVIDRIADRRNTHFAGDAQVVAAAFIAGEKM